MADSIRTAPPSAKVVHLQRGRHENPGDGACVAELVSMLADEPFSDHPVTADPAVMGFLRGYNDGIDEGLRQDLFALATDLVGSRVDERTARERAERIRAFGQDLAATNRWLRWRQRLIGGDRVQRCEPVGYLVGGHCRGHLGRHQAVLAFVRELLGCDESSSFELLRNTRKGRSEPSAARLIGSHIAW